MKGFILLEINLEMGEPYCVYFNPSPANVDNMIAPTNASKWRMGFNSAFKGLVM